MDGFEYLEQYRGAVGSLFWRAFVVAAGLVAAGLVVLIADRAEMNEPGAESAAPVDKAPESDRPKGCAPDSVEPCDCCASGHYCGGRPCGSRVDPEEAFLLRLAGGGIGGRSLYGGLVEGKVCVRARRAPKAVVCTPSEETRAGNTVTSRLPIRWRDITKDGLDIEFRDSEGKLRATASNARRSDLSERAALCKGFSITTGFEGTIRVDIVSFFVDPPEGATPANCESK
jgi:hypothetical protein